MSISQPFALYLIAIGAPFVLQIVINLLTVRSWWDFHNGSLGRKTTFFLRVLFLSC